MTLVIALFTIIVTILNDKIITRIIWLIFYGVNVIGSVILTIIIYY